MSYTEHSTRPLADSEGKGALGCLLSLVVLIVGVFAGIKTIPLYYSASSFETDVKTEVSRAGARFYDDAVVVNDILELAKKNEISVKQDNVRIHRAAGQLYATIDWTVPVDFVLFEYTFNFSIKTSSYIGRL